VIRGFVVKMTDIMDVRDVIASKLSELRSRFGSLPRGYDDIRELADLIGDALNLEVNSEMYLEAARLKHLLGIWDDMIMQNVPEGGFDRYPATTRGTGSIVDLYEAVSMLDNYVPRQNAKSDRIHGVFAELMNKFEHGIREGAPELVSTFEREIERNGPQAFYELFVGVWLEYERDNLSDLYDGQKVLLVTDVFVRPEDFAEIALKYAAEEDVARLVNPGATPMPTYLIGHIVPARSIIETLESAEREDMMVEPDTVVLVAHDPLCEFADIVLVERTKGCIPVERFATIDHGDTSVGAILNTDLWKWS
jgi:hypothetical protein